MIDRDAPVVTFDEIDSTMLEARRRADAGALEPVWLVARRQSAGRGRRGRNWTTIEGNLFATYMFTTARPPSEIALLGFAAGVAIAETVDDFSDSAATSLKWPNDVLMHGAKAAGVMLDSGACAAGAWAALGVGVNLVGAPSDLDQRTACLADLLRPDVAPPAPLTFLAALRPRLEAWDAALAADGFERLRQAWLSRAHGLGAEAEVVQGERTRRGRIAGLSARGELELDTAQGRCLIAAGDVFLPQSV